MSSLSHLLSYLRARFNVSEEGATMVEYGLMVALVAIIALVAVETLGEGVDSVFTNAGNELTDTVPATDG